MMLVPKTIELKAGERLFNFLKLFIYTGLEQLVLQGNLLTEIEILFVKKSTYNKIFISVVYIL